MRDIILNNFELTLVVLALGAAVLLFIGWFLARRVGSDKIARAHGGEIDLHSRQGEGTRFVVRLPRKRPDPAELPVSPMTKGTTIHA